MTSAVPNIVTLFTTVSDMELRKRFIPDSGRTLHAQGISTIAGLQMALSREPYDALVVHDCSAKLAFKVESVCLPVTTIYLLMAQQQQPLLSQDYSLPPALGIQWYPTFEAVEHAYWAPVAEAEGIPYEDLLEAENGGLDEHGNEVTYTREQMLEGMKRSGCWAFADTNTNTIHAWADASAEPQLVVHMLAHEVGHLTGTPDPDEFQDEMRAEQFGAVAAQAFALFSQRQVELAP